MLLFLILQQLNEMMTCTKYILLFALFVTITGCSGDSEEFLTEEEIAIGEDLKAKFENTTSLAFNGDTLLASQEVLDYYKANEYAPIWISAKSLSIQGDSMYYMVENARNYGLLPGMFNFSTIQK